MYKCLKITFTADLPKGLLPQSIQKNARKLPIEGVAHFLVDNVVKIIVCGSSHDVDSFLDLVYKEVSAAGIEDFFVEPFLKEKDYRGVFRILE